MNKKFKLTTPVLYLVFNRLETVKRTFLEIKKAKPTKLFIAADGPRNKLEKIKTDAVRDYILKNINWRCEVKTLFRKKNLGCKDAVSSAIEWFFENVEQGIILEDDCLPSQSFFRFCQEMLDKYRDDVQIKQINGYNFLKLRRKKYSYYMTRYPHIWGWATWRRSWRGFDKEIHKKLTPQLIKNKKISLFEKILLIKRLNDLQSKGDSTWDFQWCWAMDETEKLNISPIVNLVENIGLSGIEFTHTQENFWDKFFLSLKREEMKFPIKERVKIKKNWFLEFRLNLREVLRIILKKLF